jgi:hypothetical protein
MKFDNWYGWIAAAALVYSLWVGYAGWGCEIHLGQAWPAIKIRQAAIVIAWTLVPPIYFWFEFYFWYKPQFKDTAKKPDDFDMFKYGQEVSAKIWLAVVSALLALYFLKDIRL